VSCIDSKQTNMQITDTTAERLSNMWPTPSILALAVGGEDPLPPSKILVILSFVKTKV